MTGQHPLDKLSAAVDGQLDHDSREKVFSHLVGCDACRAEVDEQRRLKAQLGLLDCPEPSTDLMHRLLGVQEFATEPREEVRPVPTVSLRPARSVFPAAPDPRPAAATRPASRTPGAGSRRRTVVFSAAGSAAALASLLGTAFVVGDTAEPPMLQPPVNSFTVDHATTTSGYPFGDPAVMLGSVPGASHVGTGPALVLPAASTGR